MAPKERFKKLLALAVATRDSAGTRLVARVASKTVVAIAVWKLLPGPAAAFLGLWFFGYVQRCFSSGPGHEAIHSAISHSPLVNRITGTVSFALVFVPYKQARDAHLAHHRFLALDLDPEVAAMRQYGLNPENGMTKLQILWMLAKPLISPRHVYMQAIGTIEGLATCGVATVWVFFGPILFVVGGAELLLAWWVSAWTTRKFLWLLANSTEHDFALARDLSDQIDSTEED